MSYFDQHMLANRNFSREKLPSVYMCVSVCICVHVFSSRPWSRQHFNWWLSLGAWGRGGTTQRELIMHGSSGQQLSRLEFYSCYTGHGVCCGALAAVWGELRRSVSGYGECRKDQRPLDYVLLPWNKSSWWVDLKIIQNQWVFTGVNVQKGLVESNAPFNPWRMYISASKGSVEITQTDYFD